MTKPCPYLVLPPALSERYLLCSIPAYEDADTTFCDEWMVCQGKIVSREVKR